MSETLLLITNEQQCRICLDNDTPENMIHPCQCSGTSKYVHKKCIKQWILLSDNPEYKKICPTCKYKYVTETVNINDNVIKCNPIYNFLANNLWISALFHQTLLIILTLFISIFDGISHQYPNYPIYNSTAPIVHDLSGYYEPIMFVYYTFSCSLYTLFWLLTILLNIILLKNSTKLYLKFLKPSFIILSPILLIMSVYLNMLSIFLGTIVMSKLIHMWTHIHIEIISKIKSIRGFKIKNYYPPSSSQ